VLHVFCLWGGLVDYVYSLHGILVGVGEDVAWHDVNLCSTNKLQDLCFKNGGIYMKLGQHISQLVCLLRVSKLW
jgi:aarF domain-containing kinase